ncbi:hypothetical protein, partial [Aeromonas dhakensis]|uniref:hypothetical protein n=1 Tax=Aeromonas dhakensis TaxID=196024 RepID=UPI003987852F
HVEPPAFKIRENSTYEHLSFSGGLPPLSGSISIGLLLRKSTAFLGASEARGTVGLPADHAAPVQDELGLHLRLHKLSTTVYRLTPRAINDGNNKWKFSKHRLNTIT